MIYTVDYFIEKFDRIEEDRWCYGGLWASGACCVLGHCGTTLNSIGQYEFTPEGKALNGLFASIGLNPANVNDKWHPSYQQSTPKQRILAALNDIKKATQPA